MTSHTPSPVLPLRSTSLPRRQLRLHLSSAPGQAPLDGAWWPRSRAIDVEVADLVDHFPVLAGRIDRVLYSRPDWDEQPYSVPVARGRIKTGSFPQDDTHVVVLRMATGTSLRLLVVPPGHDLAHQAMTVAADPSNRWSAEQILAVGAFDEQEAPGSEQWTDEGGSWWERPEDGPPSYR